MHFDSSSDHSATEDDNTILKNTEDNDIDTPMRYEYELANTYAYFTATHSQLLS